MLKTHHFLHHLLQSKIGIIVLVIEWSNVNSTGLAYSDIRCTRSGPIVYNVTIDQRI